MSRREDSIAPPYLALSRIDNPNASEEVQREHAMRLQEAARRAADEHATKYIKGYPEKFRRLV